MSQSDTTLVKDLASSPETVLKTLYEKYYSYICHVVYKMVGDSGTAEDIAQEVFVEVWKRKDAIEINASLKGYLRRTAVNKTLNHLRKKKLELDDGGDELGAVSYDGASSQQKLEAQDLKEIIHKTIDSLPERCRIIFGLSRFEELSYREISEKLDISIKTVENQMSKALKIIRASVKNAYLE